MRISDWSSDVCSSDLPEFTIGGAKSGEETVFGRNSLVRAKIEWTFPLAFAEIVSGDGNKVYRDRIDLTGAAPFGSRTIAKRVDLSGRKWARIEVWDVARTGDYPHTDGSEELGSGREGDNRRETRWAL